jgi:hypothetical protein
MASFTASPATRSQEDKPVVLNVRPDFPTLSEYTIDELIANTVNDRVFPWRTGGG